MKSHCRLFSFKRGMLAGLLLLCACAQGKSGITAIVTDATGKGLPCRRLNLTSPDYDVNASPDYNLNAGRSDFANRIRSTGKTGMIHFDLRPARYFVYAYGVPGDRSATESIVVDRGKTTTITLITSNIHVPFCGIPGA